MKFIKVIENERNFPEGTNTINKTKIQNVRTVSAETI